MIEAKHHVRFSIGLRFELGTRYVQSNVTLTNEANQHPISKYNSSSKMTELCQQHPKSYSISKMNCYLHHLNLEGYKPRAPIQERKNKPNQMIRKRTVMLYDYKSVSNHDLIEQSLLSYQFSSLGESEVFSNSHS